MSRTEPDAAQKLEFTSSNLCYEVYELIHDVFSLRTCSYNLTKENIENKKFNSCLEYHLGKCKAPCIGLQTGLEYLQDVFCIKYIFQLDFVRARHTLTSRMMEHSKKMEFEKANILHHRLSNLNELEKKLEPVRVHQTSKHASALKRELNLKNTPLIIEAFDNSHNQGDCNVAASVRFVNQVPDKTQYRKYNIKSFVGVNDYASFDEVLTRRFQRLLDEKKQLPHLVLIDGGIGQLNVAIKVFEQLGLTNRVDLISISKNDKHKSSTIHLTDGATKSIMDSMNYSVLAKIQDEVHRFAIKFHREKYSKKLLS
jgi:excinuclease ABC subunit C